MINQNIIILGLQCTGSTYIVQSMRETIGHYYITVTPKTEEVYYNRYKLLSTKSNWYTNLHLPIEYQQFLKAFEFNESVWTILLIRKDFLDIYLTWLIREHTNHTYIHMRSYSEKEILNWKKELLLSKEVIHTKEILLNWKNDLVAFFTTLKNWPLPMDNIVIYESLLGDYSLHDHKLMLKGLDIDDNILLERMKNCENENTVLKMWRNREEKLNIVYNLDKLYNDFESVRNQFKLDENYHFDLNIYNSS